MKFALVNSSTCSIPSHLTSTNQLIEIHDQSAFVKHFPLISWDLVHGALHSALYLIEDDTSTTRLYAMYVVEESNAAYLKQQLLSNSSYCHFFDVADDDLFMFTRAHFEHYEMEQIMESIRPCSLNCVSNTEDYFWLMRDFGFDFTGSNEIMLAYQNAHALLEQHSAKTLAAFKAFFDNNW